MDRFIYSLYLFGVESDANKAALVALKATCMQRIMDGGGEISTEISGTMNGQVYQFQVARQVDQLLPDIDAALIEIEGAGTSNGRSTNFDYRFLNH